MHTFQFGPITLSRVFEPLLHPRLRALSFPPVPDIDCDDCRMVRINVLPADAKCCTFFPDLPSFQVGAILREGTGAGRERVAQFIERGRGDPLFLYASPEEKLRYRKAGEYHPRNALPCPLLDNGRCSIYAFRPYLCVGFHCGYPPTPEYRAFWNSLASLLALHSAIVSQHVMEALGLDRGRLIDVWSKVTDERSVWTDAGSLEPELAHELWQGHTPAQYYEAAYDYVVQHADTIRAELDVFRRAQLVRLFRERGVATPERVQDIETQASEPSVREPPLVAQSAFARTVVVFGDHLWTVPEHEGFVLWYHEQLTAQGAFV